MSIKESIIQNYISSINWKRDDWKISEIKEDLKKSLGEEPSVVVNWKKDVMINEVSGNAEEIKVPEYIQIVFTDLDDKIKKLQYRLSA
jgi:hypothetical protein